MQLLKRWEVSRSAHQHVVKDEDPQEIYRNIKAWSASGTDVAGSGQARASGWGGGVLGGLTPCRHFVQFPQKDFFSGVASSNPAFDKIFSFSSSFFASSLLLFVIFSSLEYATSIVRWDEKPFFFFFSNSICLTGGATALAENSEFLCRKLCEKIIFGQVFRSCLLLSIVHLMCKFRGNLEIGSLRKNIFVWKYTKFRNFNAGNYVRTYFWD